MGQVEWLKIGWGWFENTGFVNNVYFAEGTICNDHRSLPNAAGVGVGGALIP